MLNPLFVTLSIFVLFVLFNLYIRIRTFKFYRQLVQRRIQFQMSDLFSNAKWDIVLRNYPEDQALLNTFRKHMITTGILFISVIVVVLFLLFFMRSMK